MFITGLYKEEEYAPGNMRGGSIVLERPSGRGQGIRSTANRVGGPGKFPDGIIIIVPANPSVSIPRTLVLCFRDKQNCTYILLNRPSLCTYTWNQTCTLKAHWVSITFSTHVNLYLGAFAWN